MAAIKPWAGYACLLAIFCTALAAQWVTLFDGKTLNGWVNHTPVPNSAKIVVEDGAIAGTFIQAKYDTELTHWSNVLSTPREYRDFIMEFEVNGEPGVNSGIQFRSLVAGENTVVRMGGRRGERDVKLHPGSVYGYQFEIVDGDRGATGNVFDEGGRMRLLDDAMKERPGAATAYKTGEWNQCRIECRGDRIRTWVNGVLCADFRDTAYTKGIIGFQIHSVRGEPKTVRFRNIRIQELP